jgi:DNA polymerase-3 subunit epsilon
MAIANLKENKLTGKEKAILMNQLLLTRDEFVVADIETTGLSPDKGARIIELAGVKVKNREIIDTFQQLIYPEQKVYQQTIDLTGITNEMLTGQPVFGQVLPKFYQWMGNSVVVFHNAMFDWDRFLSFFFKKVGIIAQNEVIDTLILSKQYTPGLEKHGLGILCDVYGIPLSNAHRALADSEATAHLLMHFLNSFAPAFAETNGTVLAVKKGSNHTKVLEDVQQIDLFGEVTRKREEVQVNPVAETTSAEPIIVRNNFKIKRISYWEKDVSKLKKMQRIYVMLSIGDVFFDIPTKTWYNKDVPTGIEFDALHQFMLAYLQLASTEDLCEYRPRK